MASPADPIASAESLREMQARFLAALREGTDDPGGTGPQAFLPPPRGSMEGRWEIYREGYVIRLAEAIGNDYPAIRRILGPVSYRSLCARYLATFPPSAHDIGRAGARLAEYLPADPLTTKLPFLPDLARFEWALAVAVVAADDSPTSRDTLSALAPEDLLNLAVVTRPGTAVIRSDWPLADLWGCLDKKDEEVSVEVMDRPSLLLVYRDGLAVRWRSTWDEEARFIEAASRGASLGDLVDSGRFGTDASCVSRVVSLFLSLIDSSVVVVRLPETPLCASQKESVP